MLGVNAPTVSTCVPGFSHFPKINGVVVNVAAETISLLPTAVTKSGCEVTGRPSLRSCSASS